MRRAIPLGRLTTRLLVVSSQQGDRGNSLGRSGNQVGRAVSHRDQELARQLGEADGLFPVLSSHKGIIYITNGMEGYHRQVRKVTKDKDVFPSGMALEKLAYLAYWNIRKKWTMPLANWAATLRQLAIKLGDLFKSL